MANFIKPRDGSNHYAVFAPPDGEEWFRTTHKHYIRRGGKLIALSCSGTGCSWCSSTDREDRVFRRTLWPIYDVCSGEAGILAMSPKRTDQILIACERAGTEHGVADIVVHRSVGVRGMADHSVAAYALNKVRHPVDASVRASLMVDIDLATRVPSHDENEARYQAFAAGEQYTPSKDVQEAIRAAKGEAMTRHILTDDMDDMDVNVCDAISLLLVSALTEVL